MGRCLRARSRLRCLSCLSDSREERQREGEVIPDIYTQVQTSPPSLVSLIDAQMGVGGGGGRTALVWKGGTSPDLGLQKGPLDAYQRTRSGKNRRMAQMKGALMHLHPWRECFLLYQQQTCGAGLQYGGWGWMHCIKTVGGGSMSSQKRLPAYHQTADPLAQRVEQKVQVRVFVRSTGVFNYSCVVLVWFCRVT